MIVLLNKEYKKYIDDKSYMINNITANNIVNNNNNSVVGNN
jgi:hypothetical protein